MKILKLLEQKVQDNNVVKKVIEERPVDNNPAKKSWGENANCTWLEMCAVTLQILTLQKKANLKQR